MHLAAWNGNLKVFQALNKVGATIALTDYQGRSVMHHATMGGSTNIVEELLADMDTSILNKEDNKGWLPLHWACRNGANHVVVARLTEKADNSWAQLVTRRDWTPENIATFHEALSLIPSDKRTKDWKVGYCHWVFVCDRCHLEVSQSFGGSHRSIMLRSSKKISPYMAFDGVARSVNPLIFASNVPGHANTLIRMISRRCLKDRDRKPCQSLGWSEERPSPGKTIAPVIFLLCRGSIHVEFGLAGTDTL